VEAFLERIRAGERLCGDGGLGTMLMARGLAVGDSPEALNISRPELIAEIAAAYVGAGADLITTNSFGGSPLRLAAYGLDRDTERINRSAVEIVKPVAEGRAHVSASIGPTGSILTPYGDTEPERVSEAFSRQAAVLIGAGADLICIETMIDLREAVAAVRSVRELSTAIPVIATMTFDPTPRGYFTAMGVTVEQAAAGLEDAGADLVGSNCGNGIDRMVEIAAEFCRCSSLPVVIQSNAGMPDHRGDRLVYPEGPDYMADRARRLLELGVAVIGGCCGTGPDHIRALRSVIDRANRRKVHGEDQP
jgi:5-methyltetrahydrofolate--homocysteine methyltransferase